MYNALWLFCVPTSYQQYSKHTYFRQVLQKLQIHTAFFVDSFIQICCDFLHLFFLSFFFLRTKKNLVKKCRHTQIQYCVEAMKFIENKKKTLRQLKEKVKNSSTNINYVSFGERIIFNEFCFWMVLNKNESPKSNSNVINHFLMIFFTQKNPKVQLNIDKISLVLYKSFIFVAVAVNVCTLSSLSCALCYNRTCQKSTSRQMQHYHSMINKATNRQCSRPHIIASLRFCICFFFVAKLDSCLKRLAFATEKEHA